MIHSLYAAVCLAALAHASQPGALQPLEAPLRELTWGQLNFLHTTDTHGWHAGHLQE
jgi:2',3'-cyclic-nucleotide 2'-phosphodiesterase (5'-nucleotidase family)